MLKWKIIPALNKRGRKCYFANKHRNQFELYINDNSNVYNLNLFLLKNGIGNDPDYDFVTSITMGAMELKEAKEKAEILINKMIEFIDIEILGVAKC